MINSPPSPMPAPEDLPQAIAARYGLSIEALAALLDETDRVRGMCSAVEAASGLAHVIDEFGRAMSAAPSTFSDPTDQAIATQAIETGLKIYVETMRAAQSASH